MVMVICVSTSLAQEHPQEVEIIKQINKVNDDGSYTFGYEAADGSFKIETRDVMGNVKGMFGFIDETGELKRVSYTANNGTGFRAVEGDGGERTEEVTLPRESQDPTRAPVIQHIPRRLGVASTTTSTTSTTPSYGEYLKGRRTHIVLPNRSGDQTTPRTPRVKEEPEGDEPTQIPLRRLLVTKRPVLGKGGNHLRRQLGGEPETSGDVSDVYSGGSSSPRYVPVQSVRSPQSSLLANLPPHVATAIRQQQIARAASALRPYPPGLESPRGNVIDEQEYPPVRGARTNLPRGIYRPSDLEGPIDIPFPMATLRSLRDELMDYIMQYLQYRLSGGPPIPFSPYQSSPFQNPNFNPNFPYQPPVNYQGANPNFYNPYYYPNQPFPRVPYQPPFGPAGYPPVGYPPVGYPPVGGYPQPLPFSSPNKQQAPQYVPSQRSVSYEPVESQSQRGESEGRSTSDQTTYSLPPADVIRMMLARGLSTAQTSSFTTSTTTSRPLPTPAGPVRNVQILGAASSVSSTTVRPPAPVEEMHMQA